MNNLSGSVKGYIPTREESKKQVKTTEEKNLSEEEILIQQKEIAASLMEALNKTDEIYKNSAKKQYYDLKVTIDSALSIINKLN